MNTLNSLAANQYVVTPFWTYASQSHVVTSGSSTNPSRVSILEAVSYSGTGLRTAYTPHERFDSIKALFYSSQSRNTFGINTNHYVISRSAYVVNIAQTAFGEQIRPGTFRLQLQNNNTPQLVARDVYNVAVQTDLVSWSVSQSGSIGWTAYEYSDGPSQWIIRDFDQVHSSVTNNTVVARTNVTVNHAAKFRWQADIFKFSVENNVSAYLAAYVPLSTSSNGNYLRVGISRVASASSWQIQQVDASGSATNLVSASVDTWALSTGKRVIMELSSGMVNLYKSDYQTGSNETLLLSAAIPSTFLSGSQTLKLGFFEEGTSTAKFAFETPSYYTFLDSNLDVVDDTYGNLIVSQSGTGSYVGHLIYSQGIGIVNQVSQSYSVINSNGMKLFSGSVATVNFVSTMLARENKITVKLYPNEHNISLFNPTTRYATTSGSFGQTGSRAIELMVSKSLSPYVTTIGLYNNKNELLVIGKLSTPIKRTLDTIQSFIVKFDT